jgi:signal transduction histidine kinase
MYSVEEISLTINKIILSREIIIAIACLLILLIIALIYRVLKKDISLPVPNKNKQEIVDSIPESSDLLDKEQLRKISSRAEKIREEERTRIAREIHDELGQQLAAIKIELSSLKKKSLTGNIDKAEKLDEILKLVNLSLLSIRKISYDLRPGILDDLGLVSALEWFCKDFEKRTNIKCEFLSKYDDLEFEKNFSTTVYRVVQEAFTNILKHSEAKNVKLSIELDEKIFYLSIKDDGKGISKNEAESPISLGLLGMKERVAEFGGKIDIKGNANGTIIKFSVPLPQKGKNMLLRV